MDLIIIKLGGSAITNKYEKGKMKINKEILYNISTILSKIYIDHQLILIHGTGSFGHRNAIRYLKNKEINKKTNFEQYKYIILSRKNIFDLNNKIMKILWNFRLPAISLFPSSFLSTEEDEIKNFDLEIISQLLILGFIPVIHGDWAFDKKSQFSIISSDKLTSYLAINLKATRVIMISDTDGIYSEIEKNKKQIIRFIDKNNIDIVLNNLKKENDMKDATGGIYGKLIEMLKISKFGIPSILVNGSNKKSIIDAIEGKNLDNLLGTIVKPYTI
ncbi:MAG: isopentenyl phosphate kinase [Minisyncoccia bacterium]